MNNEKKLLMLIIVLTVVLRIALSFWVPNLTYDSYFHLKHTDYISEHFTPNYNDELSYGGRQYFFLPAFHYLASIFATFLPIELVGKLLPNILFGLVPFIIYLIAKEIQTKPSKGPLLSALIAGFLPISFETNSFTPHALFLPLVFTSIYAFLKIRKRLFLYVFSFLILSLTSSATFLLITGFAIYLLLSFIERKKVKQEEIEIIIFSVFLFLWTQFLFFKRVLLEEGFSFIWKNLPTQIIQEYFPAFSLILVSVIPFVVGIYVVYKALFQEKTEKTFFIISVAISTTLLTWFRFIEHRLSLAFFGLTLAILFVIGFDELLLTFRNTKVAHYKKIATIVVVLLLAITIIPAAISTSLNQQTPSNEEVQAFKSLTFSPPDTTVLALPEEGHLITMYGQRKNILDLEFSLISDAETRFKDSTSLYRSLFQTHAIEILDEYDADYLVLTKRAMEKHDTTKFKFITPDCFSLTYKNGSKIYRKRCTLKLT